MNTLLKQKRTAMKTPLLSSRWLALLFPLFAAPWAQAIWIEEEIPANLITVRAASEYAGQQGAKHLSTGRAGGRGSR